MRTFRTLRALCMLAAVALLVDCSGGGSSAIAPKPALPQGGNQSIVGRMPTFFSQLDRLGINARTPQHFVSHYSCPANGPIKYVSDRDNSVINVYVGKFAGQAPCGQIATGNSWPTGMYVKTATHDLYVANYNGHNVTVFHRGQTTPYNTYTDPTSPANPPQVFDVTVAQDGTIIASNIFSGEGGDGSLSTWIGGPNGGTFVGRFLMTNDNYGGSVTVRKNGRVFYDDFDGPSHFAAVWSLSCPAGACGVQTQVAIQDFDSAPGGMRFDAFDHLLINDPDGYGHTYVLPNPKPSGFAQQIGTYPMGLAVNRSDNHWYTADPFNDYAAEYSYPDGKLIGTVSGASGGSIQGVAIDP